MREYGRMEGPRVLGGPPRRNVLRNGLLLGAALTAGSLVSGAITSAAQASTSGPQEKWAWCSWCTGLYYYPNRAASRCPAYMDVDGGGPHGGLASYNYALAYDDTVSESDPQSGWWWCGRCQGLFYGPQQDESYCPAGGTHVNGTNIPGDPLAPTNSFDYALTRDTDTDNGQGGWYRCIKCRGLWYGGSSHTGGICPQDLGNHDGSGSSTYYIHVVPVADLTT